MEGQLIKMKAYLLLYFNCLWGSFRKSLDKYNVISNFMKYIDIMH